MSDDVERPLTLATMRRDVQSWWSVVGGNIGWSGASPNKILLVWSQNRLGGQWQHGPPYSEFLHSLSIRRFGSSRRGAGNTEGYTKGNTRWRERGASGKGCKGVTRFVSLLHKVCEWSLSDRLLYFQGKIYVPDTSDLRQWIITLSHDSWLAGHSGRWKTLELVSRNHWWPQMSRYVGRYISTFWHVPSDQVIPTSSDQRTSPPSHSTCSMGHHQRRLHCWAATICKAQFHHGYRWFRYQVCTFCFHCHNYLCCQSCTPFPQPCVETSLLRLQPIQSLQMWSDTVSIW